MFMLIYELLNMFGVNKLYSRDFWILIYELIALHMHHDFVKKRKIEEMIV